MDYYSAAGLFVISYLCLWVIFPIVCCILMGANRRVNILPWVFSCLLLGWVAPIILGMAYQLPSKAAERRRIIEEEYKSIGQQE